jgi:hypothetical protein
MIEVGVNSYVSVEELEAYATSREIVLNGTPETLLIKAMDYLESRSWIGVKTVFDQNLEFPRTVYGYGQTAYINEQYYVDPLIVPKHIKKAQIVAAILVDEGEVLQPKVGRKTKREKVDVIEVEYVENAMATTYYTQLNDFIRPYLKNNIGVNRV